MDPIHLVVEEIDYELMIRGVFNLSGKHREKSGRLREILVKESVGLLKPPALGSSPFDSQMDRDICDDICGQISLILEEESLTLSNVRECTSRAIHAGNRLNRIVTDNASFKNKICGSIDVVGPITPA